MKGEAKSQPNNHVEWANGFKSNMPDWPTARVCALSHRLLITLKAARTALLALDQRANSQWNEAIEYSRFSQIVDDVQDVIAEADGLESLREALTKMPPPPGFPKPPGF